jgi:hypothetical protein
VFSIFNDCINFTEIIAPSIDMIIRKTAAIIEKNNISSRKIIPNKTVGKMPMAPAAFVTVASGNIEDKPVNVRKDINISPKIETSVTPKGLPEIALVISDQPLWFA